MLFYYQPERMFFKSSRCSLTKARSMAFTNCQLDNLLNQRHYAYTIFNGINTYTYDYTLCGRTAMLRATFKL